MTTKLDPLIVDAYEGDGHKDWYALAGAGAPWAGAILKASQGRYYSGGTWFARAWNEVLAAAPERHGEDWFRGAYHYLDASGNGAGQADYFVGVVEHAGGFIAGDLWPMVDVERADQHAGITAAQVVDVTSAFADRIKQLTGKSTTLYGGSWLADLGITSRMGCSRLALARYAPTLPAIVYERIGWHLEHLMLWQYCGDGESHLAGYPATAPGCGKIDISALVMPGGLDGLRAALSAG